VVIQQNTPLLAMSRIINKGRLLLLLAAAVISGQAFGITTLKASVDRNPAMVAEAFNLTIVADDNVDTNSLDTSALLQDFIVGQTSVSSNTQIINGTMTRQTTWRVSLISRKSGALTIPSLKINNISSNPIIMNIVTKPQSTKDNENIKLETSISNTSVYIGQPLIYEIKLLLGTRLQRAQLQQPSLVGAEITQIGEDKDASEIVNGKRYRTITRQYNISPTQAGKFELEGSIFRGDVSQYGYGRSKPITLLGENHQIEVKAIPTEFPGDWLVSDMVVIEDEWANEKDYQVGEPITRTITLSAANVSTEQLPTLSIDAGNSLQSYPDKPKLQQGLNGSTLISQLVQKIALIPIKSGEIVVPEIKIPWFDPRTETVQWAVIKQKTLVIKPSTPSPLNTQATPPSVSSTEVSAQLPVSPSLAVQSLFPWKFLSIGLSCLLILALAVIVWLCKRKKSVPDVASKTVDVTTNIYATLLHSLDNNELSNALRLLPLWLKQDFKMTVDHPTATQFGITTQYHELAKHRFSQQTQEVDCKPLKSSVVALFKNTNTSNASQLSGLYAPKA